MIEKLRPVLVNLGMQPIKSFVTFKEITTVFNDQGKLIKGDYKKYLAEFLNNLTQKING